MWQKIFKSKSQKPQPLAKINKRHSRIAYEEYQQLTDLLAGENGQISFGNEKENEHENGNGSSSVNVFEQQPLQGSFNSLQFSEAHQLQQQQQQQQQLQKSQQQQLSTFSRVRNTFSMKRNSSSSSKKLGNAKPSESDAASAAAATVATATATSATLTNNAPGNQLQRVLIVVNKIDVATNCLTNHLHANPTEIATTNAAIKSSNFQYKLTTHFCLMKRLLCGESCV